MTIKSLLKRLFGILKRRIGWPISAAWARLMATGIRPPAFVGAYPDRTTALAHAPAGKPSSYDDDEIAPLNFELMSELHVWDYPLLHWLDRLIKPDLHVLDAGGHLGTKYIAFQDRLPLSQITWTVYDVPATIRAALKTQAAGHIPPEVQFLDTLSDVKTADILVASGLLQYLDMELHELIGQLAAPPQHILLNKVATTDGPTQVTLEKIGSGRIPYQIRNRHAFEESLSAMGYVIRDSWHIPSLSRVIATHPWLGASVSRGYYLERAK